MILTVTLNAAIDKRYVVNNFKTGEVNRVKECTYVPGDPLPARSGYFSVGHFFMFRTYGYGSPQSKEIASKKENVRVIN